MTTAAWAGGKCLFAPDTYHFKNGYVSYYIEDGKLFAQVWKIDARVNIKLYDKGYNLKRAFPIYLVKTVEIYDHDSRSMGEIINGREDE